jgi:hypothetical protein
MTLSDSDGFSKRNVYGGPQKLDRLLR